MCSPDHRSSFISCLFILFISLGVIFGLSTPVQGAPSSPNNRPKNRVDISTSYTSISVGDWQYATLSYTRQFRKWTTGIDTRLFRRELSTSAPVDWSVGVPLYTQWDRFLFFGHIGVSYQPKFFPHYTIELQPAYQFESIPFRLELTYRYAQYQTPRAQMLLPGLHWLGGVIDAGLYCYFVIPEFGPVLLTPQARFQWSITYFWRLVIWSHYGYETLNNQFVNPNRQAPQWGSFIQIKHLFTDWIGLNIGLSYVHFISDNIDILRERFNQDRLEVSLHSFWRF